MAKKSRAELENYYRSLFKLQPLEAWSALRALLRDPEDTQQVFRIVRALSGRSILRSYIRFSKTPRGLSWLDQSQQLMDILDDHNYLRALPSESLGHQYLQFVEQEALTTHGLVDVNARVEPLEYRRLEKFANRLRDQHDLWHVLTGYGRDEMGEVYLLGFTFTQTKNPSLLFIAIAGALRGVFRGEIRAILRLFAAIRQGMQTAWLPGVEWEAMLPVSLENVKSELSMAKVR